MAAGAVPEVAEQLQVVDRRLHAHAVQLQEAVLKGRKKGNVFGCQSEVL